MTTLWPQALCALLWWMATHPDEVGALAKAAVAEATEEEGDDEELDWRAQEEPVVDEPLDPNAPLPPIPAVEGVVVHREPLGRGEVLEYIWHGETWWEDGAHNKSNKKHGFYNALRVKQGNITIAAIDLLHEHYEPPYYIKPKSEYIPLWLTYKTSDGSYLTDMHILIKKDVADAIRRPNGYRTRRVTAQRAGGGGAEFEGWHGGKIYVYFSCCGVTSYMSIDPKNMEYGPLINLNPRCEIKHSLKKEKCTKNFRVSKPDTGSFDEDYTIYDQEIFYKIISKFNERFFEEEFNANQESRRLTERYGEIRVSMQVYDGAREGAMLTATVEAHCHRELPCEDDPERLCLQDKPFKVIRERRSWAADRAHLLSHVDYLKRCVGAR